MKLLSIAIIVIMGILLIGIVSAGIILNKTELTTYSATIRLDASSGYPLRLTGFNPLEIKKETALASIIPTLSVAGLSITEPYASMSGLIEIDCGMGYNDTREFYIETNIPGDRLEQTFVYKNIPPDRFCRVVAEASECQTHHANPFCLRNKVAFTIRIPK